ncbi:alpha-2 adrenergic receptor [Trichonephila clavipes]|nr:alpha-2 adrenergic receptor [Trichonephila clavipes]
MKIGNNGNLILGPFDESTPCLMIVLMNCQTKLRINHLTAVKSFAILESLRTEMAYGFRLRHDNTAMASQFCNSPCLSQFAFNNYFDWSKLKVSVVIENMAKTLAKPNEIDPFLKRMVTGDEKWVTYYNTVRKRSWSKGSKAAQTVVKPGLTARKILLCI